MKTLKGLRNKYYYDSESGKIYYLKNDKEAGYIKNGYRIIYFNGKKYPAHRIAWNLYYGEWPSKEIDHINLNRSDNRIKNLRLADRYQNMANTEKLSTNKSGNKGVYYCNSSKYWVSKITARGETYRFFSENKKEAIYIAEGIRKILHGEYGR